ncbi:MAG TPA: M20/M25/M40 family metallo-hydrolase [Bryocella sp.]|nr:M20/M25/M40 family metallo-hydrolase [Bryocella sp.]
MRDSRTTMLTMSVASALLLCAFQALAQTAPALPEQDRVLARDIFKQLIETNTQDSNGSVTAAAVKMRQRLLDAGFPAEDLVLAGPNDRKQNLVARYRGKAGSTLKPIITICHLDVVEARKADWTTDPYQFVEKDGYFYGRGTQDIKEEDAALVESFIRMKREGYVPDRDLVIALTADEEGGSSNGVAWLLEHRPDLMKADFVINPDAGGLELRGGKPTEVDVEATEKLYADFEVTATNPGGHSSQPRPDNAIYELVHALAKLEASPFPAELNAVTRAELEAKARISDPQRAQIIRGVLRDPPDPKAVAEFSKDPTDNSTLRTTCVATMVSAGHARNALPAMAESNVNCRILPGHSQEEIRQKLIHIFGDPKLTVSYVNDAGQAVGLGSAKKSMETPPAREDVYGPLRRVTEEMWPGLPVIPTMSTGASDSIITMAAGIPSYGISGMGVDFDDDRAHGRDERIRTDAFYQGVEFRYLYMEAVSK